MIGLPLALAVLALGGFLYTANALYLLFDRTLVLVVTLLVLRELALQWLRIGASTSGAAGSESTEPADRSPASLPSEPLLFQEPEVDLAALSRDTRAIVGLGVLLVLQTLGLKWSQMQWLVAALGVGIGFGLQEIVANFISGLIILFARRSGQDRSVLNTVRELNEL